MSEKSTEYLFNKYFAENLPLADEMPCPYRGMAYHEVPGYISGYGCPVCKAISFHHLPISRAAWDAHIAKHRIDGAS